MFMKGLIFGMISFLMTGNYLKTCGTVKCNIQSECLSLTFLILL